MIEEIQRRAIEWARLAGARVREAVGRVKVEHKGEIDLVTEADRETERFLIENIRREYPGHAIWAEESGHGAEGGPFRWILDPIDGTTNFAHQIPHFAVLVAVQERVAEGYETVVSATYDPMRDECFSARKGRGALLNDQPIRVSETDRLVNSTGATGFPYERWNGNENHTEFCALNLATRGIRRFGSAGLDLAWVACGRFDFYWERFLNAWDMAGGALLVQEAGGVVTDTHGAVFRPECGEVACGGPVHSALIEALALARRNPINDFQALASLRPRGTA